MSFEVDAIIRSTATAKRSNYCASKYTGMIDTLPETRFGPNVRAGFMLAPVYLPKTKARAATVEPTTTTIGIHCSVLRIIQRMEAISKNGQNLNSDEINPSGISQLVLHRSGVNQQTTHRPIGREHVLVSFVERLPLYQRRLKRLD